MMCPVCKGKGWVWAAPLSTKSVTHKVPRVALWPRAVIVPCICLSEAGVRQTK